MAVLVRILTCFHTKLIIDWHNYGYTIMEVNNVNTWLVKVGKFYELALGRFGDYHLTVSEAMKSDLLKKIPSIRSERVFVLYDRATSKFQDISDKEKYELFEKIGLEGFIKYKDDEYEVQEDRPVLLLSSTSYTPDEDFMVLLEALDICDKNQECPKIQLLVTGKGP